MSDELANSKGRKKKSKKPLTRKEKLKRFLYTVVFGTQLVLLVALIGVWVPINGKPLGYITFEVFTNNADFCINCHLMETRYASWRRSGHANVTVCMDCHSEPGFVGEWKAHFDGMRYIWAMVTKKRTGSVIQAHVKNVSCLECHEEYAELKDEIYHNLHEENGVHCTDCHDNLMVHRESLIPPEITYGAHNCVKCHDIDNPNFKGIVEKYKEKEIPVIPEFDDYSFPR